MVGRSENRSLNYKEVANMKRKFDFGCIDFEGRGTPKNRVTVEM